MDGLFHCNYRDCTKKYRTKYNLDDHIRVIHLEQRWPCKDPDCDKTYSSKEACTEHENGSHLGIRVPCEHPKCDKTYKSRTAMKRHSRAEHHGGQVLCDYTGCGKPFLTIDDMARHKDSAHSGRKFHCTYSGCKKKYTSDSALQSHIKSKHLGNNTFPCDYPDCGKVLQSYTGLKFHKETKHGGKLFYCSYPGCIRVFRSPRGLRGHQSRGDHTQAEHDTDQNHAEPANRMSSEAESRNQPRHQQQQTTPAIVHVSNHQLTQATEDTRSKDKTPIPGASDAEFPIDPALFNGQQACNDDDEGGDGNRDGGEISGDDRVSRLRGGDGGNDYNYGGGGGNYDNDVTSLSGDRDTASGRREGSSIHVSNSAPILDADVPDEDDDEYNEDDDEYNEDDDDNYDLLPELNGEIPVRGAHQQPGIARRRQKKRRREQPSCGRSIHLDSPAIPGESLSVHCSPTTAGFSNAIQPRQPGGNGGNDNGGNHGYNSPTSALQIAGDITQGRVTPVSDHGAPNGSPMAIQPQQPVGLDADPAEYGDYDNNPVPIPHSEQPSRGAQQQPGFKRKRQPQRHETRKKPRTRGWNAPEATATPEVEDSGQRRDPGDEPESHVLPESQAHHQPGECSSVRSSPTAASSFPNATQQQPINLNADQSGHGTEIMNSVHRDSDEGDDDNYIGDDLTATDFGAQIAEKIQAVREKQDLQRAATEKLQGIESDIKELEGLQHKLEDRIRELLRAQIRSYIDLGEMKAERSCRRKEVKETKQEASKERKRLRQLVRRLKEIVE